MGYTYNAKFIASLISSLYPILWQAFSGEYETLQRCSSLELRKFFAFWIYSHMAAESAQQKSGADTWQDSKLYNHYTYTSPKEAAEGDSNLAKADLMFLEGNFEQALSFYNKASQEDEERSKIVGLRGFIHCNLAQGYADKAVHYGESYMKLFPHLAKAESTWLYALANNLKNNSCDKLTEAIKTVYSPEKVRQNSEDPIYLMERIFVLYKANLLNEATRATEDWKGYFGSDLNMCQRMGEMFYMLHRYNKAFDFLQIAVQRGVNRARLWYLHALSAAANKNFDIAERSVEKAARLNCPLPFMENLASEVKRLKKQAHGGFFDFIKNMFMP